MGYEYWPQVGRVHRAPDGRRSPGFPCMVTENGIGTDDDAERIAYVSEALRGVRRCLDDGVDIRGYFVWSLLDNFEWAHGYGPKFGIFSVDPDQLRAPAQARAPLWFGEVARANALVAPAG